MLYNATEADHHRTLLAPSTGRVPHSTAIVCAWMTLKAARGQTVNLDRIGSPHHLITAPVSELQTDLNQRLPRIKDRVRELRADRMAHRPKTGGAT
ncbi:hypothetical protein [Pseudosulfitobacter pseudonitzschiae]|uniref:hypothetical protein n=1 Tax=Pseudosulfitobacter pseudonitzschiae TaxID=1402135 RepID=UPI001BB61C06|nr:hypothetical protein [Pseudosulfitobacter pseudonitzschiae]MBM1835297.1 hypothetical protein [Pseudosulfitobacter pseudonitzschiae]MBM1845869.1 hypothetical protein [Pseudosulfitobacter pseudonitzschiae]MBM1864404.1 hypothetical protein [Pseudosulfitobacter pseudonitzschiae]MBM1874053.1 hypothetical protein [Pseudosulfitobacter pseudonitzschiae]MBM1894335.1 hypothetical protein [Pseudosulfitobacter pseudonitzschiae]